MSENNLNVSPSSYIISVALTAVVGVSGYLWFNHRINQVEKEVKDVETNLLRKLTMQLASQTRVTRNVIGDSGSEGDC